MSAQSIRVLKGRHAGETVYVVASGASVDSKYTPPTFWHGKVIVAVNEMWRHVPSTFVLSHHYENLQQAIDAGQQVVTSSVDLGGPGWGAPHAFKGQYFIYTVSPYKMSLNPTIDTTALALDTVDQLVPSACTTSEALQFAAHLGAASIVCCGMEGAALDGQWSVTGYNQQHAHLPAFRNQTHTNPQHVRLTQNIVRDTVRALRARGICVSSHDPFVGFDREGHSYMPAPILSGRALIDALRTTDFKAEKVPA